MRTSVYKIGHVFIELNMPEEMMMPDNMLKFQVSGNELQNSLKMRYYLDFVDDISVTEKEMDVQKIEGKEAKRDNIRVFQTGKGECRCINFVGDDLPYAVTLKESGDVTRIWFRKACAHMLLFDTVFVSALALEKLMIDADALILHSAYMNYNGRAILFSAPSETGKSTQASLWEKYRGTYTVNGDRSLLIRGSDGWYAYGWPICGSSEICINEVHPVHAIVMLKQAKENKVYPLKGFSALREVMEQITINTWDREFQLKVMDQLEVLLGEIPVYMLECDISEDAVKCLEAELSHCEG